VLKKRSQISSESYLVDLDADVAVVVDVDVNVNGVNPQNVQTRGLFEPESCAET
jgi:hypothetical protein